MATSATVALNAGRHELLVALGSNHGNAWGVWLAFERMGLHRVGLSVFAFNERAVRSYRKAGFVEEGRLRSAIARDGRYWDEILMGALREEWLAARAAMRGRTG